MDHTQSPHYHIRWSGKATLDWESFSTRKEAEARAKELVRRKETYIIEEHYQACPRCQAAMEPKTSHGEESQHVDSLQSEGRKGSPAPKSLSARDNGGFTAD